MLRSDIDHHQRDERLWHALADRVQVQTGLHGRGVQLPGPAEHGPGRGAPIGIDHHQRGERLWHQLAGKVQVQRASTVEAYLVQLRRLRTHWGDLPVDGLDEQRVVR